MLKFCCERFKNYYSSGEVIHEGKVISETFPNIRITKLEKTRFNEGTSLIRFVIICSSLKEIGDVSYVLISYCPFCGCELYKFYKDEQYFNLDSKLLFP
jgi:hypothetical protein